MIGTIGAHGPYLVHGAFVTLQLAVLSYALALMLGAIGAAVRLRRGWLAARAVVFGYTTIVRGVPDIVLILLVYVGGQQLINLVAGAAGFGPVRVSAFWAGALAVGLIYGAYLVETFRGACLAIPEGQYEAARALGLRGPQIAGLVILPQLIRLALPACANIWQILLTSVAVVSVIGLQDIVGIAGEAGKATYRPFVFFGVALAFFLALTWFSNLGFGWLARRYALKGRHAV